MFNIINRNSCLYLLVLLLTALPVLAASEDEGLYDPVPPEGSAFVRFIHADANIEGDNPPKINGKQRDGVKFTGVKPYGVVDSGLVKTSLGPASVDFEAEPDKRYTLILKGGQLKVTEDPEAKDELKAQMIVYNMTSRDDVTLKTADGKVSIVGPLKAGEIADREINPIKVSFAIYVGDKKFADMTDWPLERKESYVVAVFEQGGKGIATYDRSRVSEE